MSAARKLLYSILLSVAVLVLSILVFIRHPNTNIKLLAIIGFLGGLAIVLNALPISKQ